MGKIRDYMGKKKHAFQEFVQKKGEAYEKKRVESRTRFDARLAGRVKDAEKEEKYLKWREKAEAKVASVEVRKQKSKSPSLLGGLAGKARDFDDNLSSGNVFGDLDGGGFGLGGGSGGDGIGDLGGGGGFGLGGGDLFGSTPKRRKKKKK